MSAFVIGDMHLGHAGIMKFGQRHFDNIDQHDECLVEAWHSVVKKKHDLVWVLGDVCMDIKKMPLLYKMNGRKILVMGNHDKFDTQVYLRHFERVQAFEKRYGFIMTHIPIHPDELIHRTWKYNVHGHIHHKEKQPDDSRYINVNIDVVGYMHPTPVEWLKTEIAARE